jgi:hypothetical protein
MDKKFTFGLIALLGVSLFILGCDDSSDDSTEPTQDALDLVADLGGKEFAEATGGGTVVLKDDVTLTTATTVKAGVTLVVPATATLTVPAGKPATINGTLIIGAGADKVTVTKATLKGGVAVGAGTLTLINNEVLTLADTGTIVVTGTAGKVILPNTEFGAGTYKAKGVVTITALTGGDTIATPGTSAGDGLTFYVGSDATDSIALTATATAAASYELDAVATSGEKITFGAADSKAAITIPGHGSNNAANFTVPADGTLVIGQGTNGGAIVLKAAAKGGILTTGSNSIIKGIKITNNSSTNGAFTITGVTIATAKSSGSDSPAAASNGILKTTTGGTLKATSASVDLTITKATTADVDAS